MLFWLVLTTLFTLLVAAPTASSTVSSTATAPASAATSCPAKVFDKPWILSDITIYTPAGQDPQNQHGAISFHFCDKNARLHLETNCDGTVINDACEGDDGGYVICENSNVSFKYASSLIMVERWYLDDCLGPFPYNSGEAFGQNNVQMTVTNDTSGTMAMQEKLLVEITEMA